MLGEIKDINQNNHKNNAQIRNKELIEQINFNFNNYLHLHQEKEFNPKLELTESNLPRIDEVISDPYIYLLNSKLLFSVKNQIDMGLIPEGEDTLKDKQNTLSNLNVLIFITLWMKTKNFKNWIFSKKSDNIYALSQLNPIKIKVSEIYDYNNNEYDGYFQFGKKNGEGILYYFHREMTYVGNFKNDLREGKGNLSSADNKYLYEGDFKNDKFDGEGSLVCPEKGKYVGSFKDDIFEGKGTYIDLENNLYEGMFKSGKKCGDGELSLINGNKYIGSFKNDKYNGKGKIVDKDGNIIQEGNFKEGNFISKSQK